MGWGWRGAVVLLLIDPQSTTFHHAEKARAKDDS